MSDYLSSMFRRRQNDGWFRVGRFDATTTDIVCAVAVFTMFVYGLAGASTWSRFVFFPPLVRDLDLWRVATWSVATEPDFFPLLGIVFFWLFGQSLEGLMGRNRFLAWFAISTIAPALVMTLLGTVNDTLDRTTIASGLQILFLCGIWVYAATYPGVRWFEVVPLWVLAAVFTGLDLLRYNGDGLRGMVLFEILAILISLSAARSFGQATGWPIPHLPLGQSSGQRRPARAKPAKKSKRRRSSGSGGKGSKGSGDRVVEGPWQRGPAPQPPRTGPSPQDQVELDHLLDKIAAGGMESLSADEKRRLNELSKRLRG